VRKCASNCLQVLYKPGSIGPEMDVLGLGQYIRKQRESSRLSLRSLAGLTGISGPYLSQVERGLR
jgi:hypothetical protein